MVNIKFGKIMASYLYLVIMRLGKGLENGRGLIGKGKKIQLKSIMMDNYMG